MFPTLYAYFMRNAQGGDYSKALGGQTMKESPTQREATGSLQTVWTKLGGTIAMIAVALIPAFAEVTPDTQWWEVPPTNRISDVFARGMSGCRYIAPWDCTSGKPAVSLGDVSYRSGDAYVVCAVNPSERVYRHSIVMSGTADDGQKTYTDVAFRFTNGVASSYSDYPSLATAMYAAGIVGKGADEGWVSATGTLTSDGTSIAIDSVCAYDGGDVLISLLKENESGLRESKAMITTASALSDTVELYSGSSGTINYRPSGSEYVSGSSSSEVESARVCVNDTYWYDGSSWRLASASSLSGHTFDFKTMQGMYEAMKAAVECLGGSVTNYPSFN